MTISPDSARVHAILSCAAAKGREALASHLAHSTALTFEAAVAALNAAPAEAALTRILRTYREATGQ